MLNIFSITLLASLCFEHANVSFYGVDSQTHEVVLDDHSDKALVPASCMKLVTTAAALELLGPEMRFETDLEYDGYMDSRGVLHGNLYIHGKGDPVLGPDQIPLWVAAIKKLNIKIIQGKIIGDATLWEPRNAVASWCWEDLGNYYGAGASALSFNENYYTLFFKPGEKIGDPAQILRKDPNLPMIFIDNEVTTGPLHSGDLATVYGSELSPYQKVQGTIPLGVEEFPIKVAIPDPASAASYLLSQALEKNQISIQAKKLFPPTERVVFHTTYSPPLKEIIHQTNQKSINLYAEHCLKKIGELVLSKGSTDAGARAITAFWQTQGIDLTGFHMADGSGLSRKNCISAKQLVSILLKMQNSPHFPIFLASLPKKTEHIQAKSGSMNLIRCFAGFVDETAFALLVNQSTDPEMKNSLEKLMLTLEEKNR